MFFAFLARTKWWKLDRCKKIGSLSSLLLFLLLFLLFSTTWLSFINTTYCHFWRNLFSYTIFIIFVFILIIFLLRILILFTRVIIIILTSVFLFFLAAFNLVEGHFLFFYTIIANSSLTINVFYEIALDTFSSNIFW